jgi:hypothetical protein
MQVFMEVKCTQEVSNTSKYMMALLQRSGSGRGTSSGGGGAFENYGYGMKVAAMYNFYSVGGGQNPGGWERR